MLTQYGKHTCTTKNLNKCSSNLVKQAISADCGTKPCETLSVVVLSDLWGRKKWVD